MACLDFTNITFSVSTNPRKQDIKITGGRLNWDNVELQGVVFERTLHDSVVLHCVDCS